VSIEEKIRTKGRRTSKLTVVVKGERLVISYDRSRSVPTDTMEIDFSATPLNKRQETGFKVKSFALKDKLIFTKSLSGDSTIVVFTEGNSLKYFIHNDHRTHPLTPLLTVKSKTFLHLSKRHLRLFYACFIDNRYELPINATYLTIGDDYKKEMDYPVFRHFPSKIELIKKAIFVNKIPIAPLLEGEPTISEKIGVSVDIDGTVMAGHYLTKGSKRLEARGRKWFYAPITRVRRKGYSVSVRRNGFGGLNIVRRPLSEIEKTIKFRFYESMFVSFCLYHAAHAARRLSSRVVNIYFEKSANQAEEGAVDLFRKARASSITSNYFIINKESKDFLSIKDEAGVIPNFTLRSYWLLYRANNFISTETAGHANVLRSDNRYMRSAPYSQRFIFLQHGVTYMKAHEKNTSFTRNREAEPDYMIVNSKKERDVVVDMLDLEEERVLNTGMLIFDQIPYGHIDQKSPDVVTIMLTWKPYEEHLKDATKSTYYRTVIELYDILEPLVGKGNIRMVVHPKFSEHMKKTDMAEAMWQGTIADVLKETKLLITDYSSVCYNVLYQGGAVVYYQPDLDQYEHANGKLIPADNEYTGYRVFTETEARKLIEGSIKNGNIDLSKLRTKAHVDNYLAINEHHDGRNIDRIYSELERIGAL